MRFLYLVLVIVSFIACKSENISDFITGSWYSYNEELYEEVHINDSVFVYCYGKNADIIIPLSYTVQEDTVRLFNNKNSIIDKYQVSLIKGNKNQVLLINKNKKLLLNRLDITINNLDSIFTSTETLDAFSEKFYERSKERFPR